MQNLEVQIRDEPSLTQALTSESLSPYLSAALTESVSKHVSSLPLEDQIIFLMRFTSANDSLDPPTTSGAWKIALVLGLSYFSGLIPLIPYMAVQRKEVELALYISIGITVLSLVIFGWGKTALMIGRGAKGWVLTCAVGAIECLGVVGVGAGISVVVIRAVGGTL